MILNDKTPQKPQQSPPPQQPNPGPKSRPQPITDSLDIDKYRNRK